MFDCIVIGGGAAGVFAAISAQSAHPSSSVLLLEKSAVLLAKVRVSGGGRCNVTHSCFEPAALIRNYPRGSKELLGPFHRFQPKDTIEWFSSRGVNLKTEEDGRIFPITDSSETIIDCLLNEARASGVEIRLRQKIRSIQRHSSHFEISLENAPPLQTLRLILATGSTPDGHAWAESLGHTIQKPVPSLFTFNIPSSPLKHLSGISVDSVEIKIGSLTQKGPLLITHFGFSGPAALKLSAWGARTFHSENYQIDIAVNWIPSRSQETTLAILHETKNKSPHRTLQNENPFPLPKNLWKALVSTEKRLCDVSLKELRQLSEKLHRDIYRVEGKTTHKEEFVTCGGVSLNEIDFKTMQSKICPNLFFAGEILDIDGITGGFNFQNAWTTGYLAGQG